MHADDDVRTPALKQIRDITHAAFMKKLARLRPDVVHAPVEILHPVLPVAQYPVVQPHQLRAEMMRLLNCAHDPDRIRLTIKKLLHTRDNRRRSGTMPATSVRRDDQDLRDASAACALNSNPRTGSPECSVFSTALRAFFISRSSFLIWIKCPGLNGSDG